MDNKEKYWRAVQVLYMQSMLKVVGHILFVVLMQSNHYGSISEYAEHKKVLVEAAEELSKYRNTFLGV